MADYFGTTGDDVITASDGSDLIYASGGNDTVSGGADFDTMFFVFGDDFSPGITFTGADRTILFGASSISDSAGQFTTTYDGVEQVFLELLGFSGDPTVVTTIDASLQTGASLVKVRAPFLAGELHYFGSAGSDELILNEGNHFIDGSAGEDTLRLETDYDLFIGKVGTSVLLGADGKIITADNIEAFEIISYGGLVDASEVDVALQIYVTPNNAMVLGGSGADSFTLGAIAPVTSYTQVFGGDGADNYILYSNGLGLDLIHIGDFAEGDSLDYSGLIPSSGPISFIGTGAFTGQVRQLRYEKIGDTTVAQMDLDGDGFADTSVTIDNGAFDLEETSPGSGILKIDDPNVNHIFGTDGSDILDTTAVTDIVDALAGNDLIYGSSGPDTVDAGLDQDALFFDFSSAARGLSAEFDDRVIIVTDSQIIDSAGQIATSFTNVEQIYLYGIEGFASGQTIIDASGFTGTHMVVTDFGLDDLTFIGSQAADNVSVAMGSHDLDGGGGADLLSVSVDGVVTITETAGELQFVSGSDTMLARNFETLEISMASGTGSANASTLTRPIIFSIGAGITAVGGSGNDVFSNFYGPGGPSGPSTLTGGAGADRYFYAAFGVNFDGDHITDFALVDTIDLTGVNALTPATPVNFIGSGAFTGQVNQVRYVKSGGTTQLQVDENGDGVADATLTIDNGAFDIEETSPGSGVLRIKFNFNATEGDDVITGTPGPDTIDGLGGNDIINGLGSNDLLLGGDGDDTLSGGLGIDTVDGGAGNDRLVADPSPIATFGETFLGGDGIDTLVLGTGSPGTSYNLTNASLNSIERIEFANTPGTKLLQLSFTQIGGGIAANAEIVGSPGLDQIVINATGLVGSTTITMPAFQFTNFGVGDFITLTASDPNPHVLNARDNVAATQVLRGGAGTDTLNGSNGTDILAATAGGDILRGNGGNDSFQFVQQANPGPPGQPPVFSQPTFFTGGSADGGSGNDRLLIVGDIDIRDMELSAIEAITLQMLTVVVNGPGGPVTTHHPAVLRTDTEVLGKSPDYLVGGEGRILLDLSGDKFDGSGLTFATTSNIIIEVTGSDDDDKIIGSSNGDVLKGGLGDDQLQGGLGADILIGGGGEDKFVYESTAEAGLAALHDEITDFEVGLDLIALNKIDANINQNGNQAFTFIGDAAFGNVAGQLRAYADGGNTIVAGDVNGDGLADFEILVIGSVPLTSADFML